MENKRLLSLDILRGITVAAMIFVNNGYGDSYHMLNHSKWNGMTPCDLVFPFFLFIMGISTYLSLSKTEFKPTAHVLKHVAKRTILLFAIGLLINWFDKAIGGDFLCFDHLRVWAVMQRIALCYCGVTIFALFCNHKYIIYTVLGLLAAYSAILLLGNGYVYDAQTNILAQVDLNLFGYDHLYHKSPVDPEGLVATISGIAHTLIGFYCGMRIKKADTIEKKIINLFVVGTIILSCGYLLSFGMPLNKRIWSPSYVLVTCGLASLLQALLMYIIDVKSKMSWTPFFHIFGVNALALYVSSEFIQIIICNMGINDGIYNICHAIIPVAEPASFIYALIIVLLNFCIVGYPLWKRKIFIKL